MKPLLGIGCQIVTLDNGRHVVFARRSSGGSRSSFGGFVGLKSPIKVLRGDSADIVRVEKPRTAIEATESAVPFRWSFDIEAYVLAETDPFGSGVIWFTNGLLMQEYWITVHVNGVLVYDEAYTAGISGQYFSTAFNSLGQVYEFVVTLYADSSKAVVLRTETDSVTYPV